jgi:hypothetical protein
MMGMNEREREAFRIIWAAKQAVAYRHPLTRAEWAIEQFKSERVRAKRMGGDGIIRKSWPNEPRAPKASPYVLMAGRGVFAK